MHPDAGDRNHSWWGVMLRGAAMGFADIVPGVSGGTIAFITGIYARLLMAINVASSPRVLLLLARGRIRVFWKAIDGSFLALLLAGIAAAILAGIRGIDYLLSNQLTPLLGFFSGLTLCAAFLLLRPVRIAAPANAACLLIGLALALLVQTASPAEMRGMPNLQAFFAAGMLALCAMVLPGISGSLLLLLLGIYPFLIEAVRMGDLAVMASFAAGGLIGLALFARLLLRLLRRWPHPTVSALTGIMLGALPRLWPWREAGDGTDAILQPAVLPTSAAEPRLAATLAFALLGAALLAGIELAAKSMREAGG